MSETVEIGNMLYQPHTCDAGRYLGRPAIKVVKRAGQGRTRFAPPAGSYVHIKTIVYRDELERDRALAERQASADLHAMRKAQDRAQRAKPHAYKVGDILVCSWGYEQTNVDFYTVTATTAHTVSIAPIASGLTGSEGGQMSGYAAPEMPVRVVGEAHTHRASGEGRVSLTSYSSAGMWDGKEKYTSWYA